MSRSRARLFATSRSGGRILRPDAGVPPHPAWFAERLEAASPLDRVARALTAAVHRGAGSQARADILHGVWLGHPVHPAASDLPTGCWVCASMLDLVPGSGPASQALIAIGLAGAAPAVATGLADWSVLHRGQQRVGLAHAFASVGACALFAASLLARLRDRAAGGRALSAAGLAFLAAGSYLGRHLAFPLAAGASHAEPVGHLAPLGWHDLCRLYELPEGRLVRRRLGYLGLAVLRHGSEVLALADRCAHLGGPLHQGVLAETADGPCVACPWHGSTFSLDDGSVVHGPATARQPPFQTRLIEGGMVQVRPAMARY